MWNYEDLVKFENQFLDKVDKGEIKQDIAPKEDGVNLSKEFLCSLEKKCQSGYQKHPDLFSKIL